MWKVSEIEYWIFTSINSRLTGIRAFWGAPGGRMPFTAGLHLPAGTQTWGSHTMAGFPFQLSLKGIYQSTPNACAGKRSFAWEAQARRRSVSIRFTVSLLRSLDIDATEIPWTVHEPQKVVRKQQRHRGSPKNPCWPILLGGSTPWSHVENKPPSEALDKCR